MSNEKINNDFEELKELIPHMNVQVPVEIMEEPVKCLIEDEELTGLYDEILNNFRDDRNLTDGILSGFAESVVNGGDASTSSKEALVNLIKIKTEITDKMSKIADLKTRLKMKDRDTYKPYLTAKQNNNTTININDNKRQLIKKIEEMSKLENNQ